MFPVIPRSQTRHCKGQLGIIIKSIFAGQPADAVERFEKCIADYCGVGHSVVFSSGRAAFRALLDALDYPRDSVVLMPSLNYPAMPLTVAEYGLNVTWIPLAKRELAPDFKKMPAAPPANAKALVWPHYFGFAGPVDELLSYCGKYGLDLIEDSAHSLGARYSGSHVGGFGRASIFSFETSKIVNTLGGGVVTTNDSGLYEKLIRVKNNLPPKSTAAFMKNVLKSYASAAVTSTAGATLVLYPALALSRMAGIGDVLGERPGGSSPAPPGAYTPAQALTGLRHMEDFDRNLAVLHKQFTEIQNCIDESGRGLRFPEKSRPSGFMTAGFCGNTALLSKLFFKNGVDIKVNYMRDCQNLNIGSGSEYCDPVAPSLFHIPTRIGLTDKAFSRYMTTIRRVLESAPREL